MHQAGALTGAGQEERIHDLLASDTRLELQSRCLASGFRRTSIPSKSHYRLRRGHWAFLKAIASLFLYICGRQANSFLKYG